MADTQKLIVSILIIGVTLIIGIFIFSTIGDEVFSEDASNSSTQSILTQTSSTLSPIGEGITSSLLIRKNDTWTDYNGITDYLLSERYDTISFWYKNSTTDWIFIVNSSGILYVNGSLGTPEIYPVYDNGGNMFIGKIDAITFFNGSIDDFRGYNNSIDADLVNLTYLGGRL